MAEFNLRRKHVPAFGSWDCNRDTTPFTQCFESSRQAGLLRYSYSSGDTDLHVAGESYENATIVVPRHRGYTKEVKAPPSPVSLPLSTPPYIHAPKPVEEDLYRIAPGLVRAKGNRKRSRGFFSCLFPDCLC